MTKLLEQAWAEVAKLRPEEQDAIAAIVLEEIASERRWDELFAKSQDVLQRMADEAREDIAAGRSRPFDPADIELTHL